MPLFLARLSPEPVTMGDFADVPPAGSAADPGRPGFALPQSVATAVLAQAQQAYADGDFTGALALFQRAAAMPSASAIRACNGEYLSYRRLGREEEAQAAFARVVAEGLAARVLAVKLLFMPGTTDFWSDPAVSGAYDVWLQIIATQASMAGAACMNVVGHTSRTGEEAFNRQLSLARGERVQELLQGKAPSLGPRLSATGRGWAETLIGSGTDDARDAIDRRVEFRIEDCPPSVAQ